MLGYTFWTADRLTSLSRATAAQADLRRRPVLAPQLAACCKIAMSIGMSYMLILML